MQDTFGVSPYGGDLDKFPARLVDALIIIREEESKVNNLMVSPSSEPTPKNQQKGRR
jgi:hypothetical protein